MEKQQEKKVELIGLGGGLALRHLDSILWSLKDSTNFEFTYRCFHYDFGGLNSPYVSKHYFATEFRPGPLANWLNNVVLLENDKTMIVIELGVEPSLDYEVLPPLNKGWEWLAVEVPPAFILPVLQRPVVEIVVRRSGLMEAVTEWHDVVVVIYFPFRRAKGFARPDEESNLRPVFNGPETPFAEEEGDDGLEGLGLEVDKVDEVDQE